ncbi:hypothetical protein E2562_006411 [Oryza meyeriana var. granulata]|uniref:Uncharacterized protein n=1 Tax=Oryza meyeriana var. granulata TaxID=110450 RepID=A0A6G1EFJ7_9ORYZ|nr:hypothetical protein E2562_006411 [Oryza meyeriana var. granulata]
MAAAARVFRGCRVLMSPAAAAGSKRPTSAAAKVTKTEAAKAKEKRGIMQPVPVSDALRRFAGGAPEISRAGAASSSRPTSRPTASRSMAQLCPLESSEKTALMELLHTFEDIKSVWQGADASIQEPSQAKGKQVQFKTR